MLDIRDDQIRFWQRTPNTAIKTQQKISILAQTLYKTASTLEVGKSKLSRATLYAVKK
ncbi:hypothetical protein [Pseudoalteromonas luteoviolacea]|uniref:Uncharacterized protein n=1 Tax=Pseudoalteromonas luteoviolacea NCIMB 1942 TaxID=1365253 RepID=A0A167AK74_9GAMM|nr:hypothetical protein [Pseudoalteromonas luteoviolacea]KZN45491.1 hypothetical protein N482_14735 [Pseudoalteromonas luteoviolacea NCIMB 1942]